jgi:hypothetical protein
MKTARVSDRASIHRVNLLGSSFIFPRDCEGL